MSILIICTQYYIHLLLPRILNEYSFILNIFELIDEYCCVPNLAYCTQYILFFISYCSCLDEYCY